jgi:hypothetical protein
VERSREVAEINYRKISIDQNLNDTVNKREMNPTMESGPNNNVPRRDRMYVYAAYSEWGKRLINLDEYQELATDSKDDSVVAAGDGAGSDGDAA